jgi:DNA polymerase-3 subunit beta
MSNPLMMELRPGKWHWHEPHVSVRIAKDCDATGQGDKAQIERAIKGAPKGAALMADAKTLFVQSPTFVVRVPLVEPGQDWTESEAPLLGTLPAGTLQEIITSAGYCMSQDETRLALNGVHIETADGELIAVCTDGHRLSVHRTPWDGDPLNIWISRWAAAELLSLQGEVQVYEGPRFATPTVEVVANPIDGAFPDWRKVVPEPEGHRIEADREEMLDACERIARTQDRRSMICKLEAKEGRLTILSSGPIMELRADIDCEGEMPECGFNAMYLADALARCSTPRAVMHIVDKYSPMLMQWPAGCAVIMPMRV